MSPTGRVTLPVEARRLLDLKGEAFFDVHVEKGTIVLRPVAIVPLDQVRTSALRGTPA